LAWFSLFNKATNSKGEKTMEAIKRTQHNINEAFYFLTDRYPGLFALLVTMGIIAGLIR